MKTNEYVQKRLDKYTLFAATMLATAVGAEGAIIHTTLDPDESVDNDSYDIDFDGDGSFELSITHSHSMSGGFAYERIYATGLSPDVDVQVVASGSTAFQNNYFDPIDSGADFAGSAVLGYFFNSVNFQGWPENTEGYLGVRFDLPDGTHYGWVRLEVNTGGDGFTISGYGYEDKVNKLIKAGDVECLAPTATATVLSSESVEFNWNTPETAGAFKLRGREAGTPNFVNRLVFANSKTISNLDPSTSYEWQMRSFCNDTTVSAWAPLQTFTTPAARESFANTNTYIANGNLYVQASNEPLTLIRLYDLNGRVVVAREENISSTIVSLQHLPAGAYLLEVARSGKSQMRELVKF